MSSTFGQRLHAARKARNVSQDSLGFDIGCSNDRISYIERHCHEEDAKAARFVALADALHVSLDWLLAGRGVGPPLDPDLYLHRALQRGRP